MSEPSSAPAGGSPIDEILGAPQRIKAWWAGLTQVFDPAFLILMCVEYAAA
eukprot:COSAG06_NODE_61951_length_266_cov_0.658683_1_plen_50_part_10